MNNFPKLELEQTEKQSDKKLSLGSIKPYDSNSFIRKPEIIRGSNNRFKSAVEPFIADEMSDANRLQLETLFGDLWVEYKTAIAVGRNIDVEAVQAISDSFAVQSPSSALKLGLVDGLRFEDEVKASLMKIIFLL